MNKTFLILFLLFFSRLHAQKFSWENSPHYVVEDSLKYTFNMIQDDLMYLYVNFPQWIHHQEFGKSEFGLNLTCVRLGSEIPKKNCVFLVGNIHAREDYSSKFLMKFLNIFLLNLENQDFTYPNAKKILDSIDIYFLPVANPDGLKIAQLDFVGIEDSFNIYCDEICMEESFEEWKANGKGIDLNSNFDDGNHHLKIGGTFHEFCSSEGFKGSSPCEAKETQAIQDFISAKKPIMTISFHTKGNILFWADKGTTKRFNGLDKKINEEVSLKSGFKLAKISKKPSDYGSGLENYVRARHSLFGTCVELSPPGTGRSQHPDNQFNNYVWEQAWEIPYIYLENAVRYGQELRKISE